MPYYQGDYYRGDYYRGDYYRGDPAIFGAIKSAISKVAGVVGSVVPGPVGAVAKVLSNATGGKPPIPPPTAKLAPVTVNTMAIAPRAPSPLVSAPALGKFLVDKVSQVTRAVTTSPGKAAAEVVARGQPTFGQGGIYRYNRDGSMRKRPRMNVTNPRALRRAIRRANGFAKLAKKVLRFTQVKPPKGRVTFKTGRKR